MASATRSSRWGRSIVPAAACLMLAAAPAAAQAGDLADLEFMTGCWEGAVDGSSDRIRESYSMADGELILGNSQVFRDGKTQFFEFSRIEVADGKVRFVPYPLGKSSVPFELVSLEGRRAVFENLEHDFPQRIIYSLEDDGSLVARIESADAEGPAPQEFHMKAVPCGTSAELLGAAAARGESAMNAANEMEGKFVWFELTTSDPDRARDFYTDLFGWSATSVDMGEMGTYTLLKSGDRDVAGLAAGEPGSPSSWLGYVAVADVDAAVQRAQGRGGAVIVPPTDIPDVGRFAIVQDPSGTVISPFRSSSGGSPPGPAAGPSFVWQELASPDPESSAAFYGDLFGWSSNAMDLGEMGPYWLLQAGGGDVAGLAPLSPEGGEAGWLYYVGVEDVDASSARAGELGGQVVVPPTDIPDVGRFAVVVDPTGASVALFKAVG